jgi:hypothetical protein
LREMAGDREILERAVAARECADAPLRARGWSA